MSPIRYVHPIDPDSVLVAHYQQGEDLWRRNVSPVVLSGQIEVPELPRHLLATWGREWAEQPGVESGDVEQLVLARARRAWPGYRASVNAVSNWLDSLGLPAVLEQATIDGDLALMACQGARYHHDAGQYGGKAFCNLFLTDTPDCEVHFPAIGHRIALKRGTVMVFDTCQPHGVVRKGQAGFDAADFVGAINCMAVFLTWELPIDNTAVRRVFQVDSEADNRLETKALGGCVTRNDKSLEVCPGTGQWLCHSPP